jgi:hypoxanthine phosphoribosyltransferase
MVNTGGPDAELSFAHESEANFARFLDFYRIEWRYEPVCFPLDRDSQGRVTRSFTPDFYLPQFELYVELTTMKQSLVTPKNRKIRQMRALYPDLKLKILYGRDYRKLQFKFGILA